MLVDIAMLQACSRELTTANKGPIQYVKGVKKIEKDGIFLKSDLRFNRLQRSYG